MTQRPAIVSAGAHDVGRVLANAAAGRFPADDGTVAVVAESVGPASAVLAFSAHFMVCAPVAPTWVADRVDPTSFTDTHSPAFLQALADELGAEIGALDVVLAGGPDAAAHEALAGLRSSDGLVQVESSHPRVARARRHRHDVTTFEVADGTGLVVLGRGVAGRWEASFEVAPATRRTGLGRRLAQAARALVVDGSPTFVQVSPGNVASLRTVLSAGFVPIGSEVLLPTQT